MPKLHLVAKHREKSTQVPAAAMEGRVTDRCVPDDVPSEPDSGAITRVQPKLSVREVDGRCRSAPIDEELWVRYDAC